MIYARRAEAWEYDSGLKSEAWEEIERIERERDEIERADRRKRRREEERRNQSSAKRRPCQWCGGPLTAIGTARKNGTNRHGDWKKRAYHKKCLKLMRR